MVTDDLVSRARAGDGQAFRELAESHRREFGTYLRGPAGSRHAAGFYVLTLAGNRICGITRFDNSVLPSFGLPRSLSSR